DLLDYLCRDVATLATKGVEALKGIEAAAAFAPRVARSVDGRFRFDDVARGTTVAIAAVHPVEGLASATGVKLTAAGPVDPLELTLVPGVVLVGSVVDEQGVPLENAHVSISSQWGDDHRSATSTLANVSSDAAGRYRSAPFAFHSFSISVFVPGFVRTAESRVVVPEGEREHAVDFKLKRAATWRGRVVTADGAPARLARVPGELVVGESMNDPRGKANSFDWVVERGKLLLEDDTYEITPSNPLAQYVGVWCGEPLLGAAELVGRDHTADIVVELGKARSKTKGALLVDVVAGRDGTPVADFELSWQRDPLEEIQAEWKYEKRKFAGS